MDQKFEFETNEDFETRVKRSNLLRNLLIVLVVLAAAYVFFGIGHSILGLVMAIFYLFTGRVA